MYNSANEGRHPSIVDVSRGEYICGNSVVLWRNKGHSLFLGWDKQVNTTMYCYYTNSTLHSSHVCYFTCTPHLWLIAIVIWHMADLSPLSRLKWFDHHSKLYGSGDGVHNKPKSCFQICGPSWIKDREEAVSVVCCNIAWYICNHAVVIELLKLFVGGNRLFGFTMTNFRQAKFALGSVNVYKKACWKNQSASLYQLGNMYAYTHTRLRKEFQECAIHMTICFWGIPLHTQT